MATASQLSTSQRIISAVSSYDLLKDFLVDLSKRNKDNLENVSKWAGAFRERAVIDSVLLMTKNLRLNPEAGYHAIELQERFMNKQITDLLIQAQEPTNPPQHLDQAIFESLNEKFPLAVFACVQIASKISQYYDSVDVKTAVRYLHSVGHSVSRQAVLDSELMVLKELDFRLHIPNPLTYVDALLEALGYNMPVLPADQLRDLCYDVLQCFTYQRSAIYKTLLMVTTECPTPSEEQREKFVKVSEDCMLLAVGVIAVGAYINNVGNWEKVIEELRHITGISQKSIFKFSQAHERVCKLLCDNYTKKLCSNVCK